MNGFKTLSHVGSLGSNYYIKFKILQLNIQYFHLKKNCKRLDDKIIRPIIVL